jgi:hypothetical protein
MLGVEAGPGKAGRGWESETFEPVALPRGATQRCRFLEFVSRHNRFVRESRDWIHAKVLGKERGGPLVETMDRTSSLNLHDHS